MPPAIDRKARLRLPPQPKRQQSPADRIRNWDEVFCGFDLATAAAEAERCLQCPAAPCTKACPLGNDIAAALWQIERGDPIAAADVFRLTSNMPEVCGRVCPQEKLCEGACVVGLKGKATPVRIGALEQFAADTQRAASGVPAPTVTRDGRPVAVIGAGPAGLAAAEELAKLGHPVSVFDAWPLPGGTLRYGIPSFKLAKSVVDDKIEQLRTMGIAFEPEQVLGRDIDLHALRAAGFAAIFLGFGASLGNRLDIPGEDLPGVFGATDFLIRANLAAAQLPADRRAPLDIGRCVVVIGGGDTASDCARSAVRLGARKVSCVYRRNEAEMTGRLEERRYAREEGVRFAFLAAPVRILGERHVEAIELVRMELGEPDPSSRRGVRPIPGSDFALPCDAVVVATGYRVDPAASAALPGLRARDASAIVKADPVSCRTNLRGVYCGGDAATGPHLVATAIAAGRRAARTIHQDLKDRPPT